VEVIAPNEMLAEYAKNQSIFSKKLPLAPGTYRLNIIAKDVVGGNLGSSEMPITVPRLDADKATVSTLVLADLIQDLPTRSIGTGQFVIGGSKVRPRMGEIFKRNESMGIYMKVYNLAADENSHKPEGQVNYVLIKNGSNEKLIDFTEQISEIP